MGQTETAKDVMHAVTGVVAPDATLSAACAAMRSESVSSVIVKDGNAVVGVVSASDMVQAIAEGKNVITVPVSEIMTADVKGVDINASVEQIIDDFGTHQVRRLLVNDKGATVGIITRNDILQRYRQQLDNYSEELEQAVQERTVALRQVNDVHDSMLGTAAHDIRNPLGVILAWVEILQDDLSDTMNLEVAEGLETINAQTRHILHILNGLLDVNRIESGRIKLDVAAVNPVELIMSCVKNKEPMAAKKGIPLDNRCPMDLPLIEADRERLSNVFSELLDNAIKYSEGASLITLAGRANATHVTIQVTDQGVGIPQAEQDKLFKAFSTTSARPTGNEKNAGLGLAIAKKIVDLHKGLICVASNPGEGTTFSVAIPLAQTSAEAS